MGVGPFAIYRLSTSDAPIMALDMGTPGAGPITIGKMPGQQSAYAEFLPQVQVWGTAVPIMYQTFKENTDGTADLISTKIWLLRRGGGLDDQPIAIQGNVDRALVAPDARSIVVLTSVQNDSKDLDVSIVGADGIQKHLGRIIRGGTKNEYGDLTPIAWLPDGGWLALPICACESSPKAWYTLTTNARVFKNESFGVPRDIFPSTTKDGRHVALTVQSTRDCSSKGGRPESCPAGPARILVVDTSTNKISELASYSTGDDLPNLRAAITPDGTRVVATSARADSLQVVEVASKRIVTMITVPGEELIPDAWIDDSRLLVSATSLHRGDRAAERLLLVRIGVSHATITELVRSDYIDFRGWVA